MRKVIYIRALRSRLQEIRAGPEPRSLQYCRAPRGGEDRLTKTHYGEEAYNETRSRSLWQVQKDWEEPVRQYGAYGRPEHRGVRASDAGGTARITNKLNRIIIPKIEFRDATIREAIDFVRQQAEANNDPATEGRKRVSTSSCALTPLGSAPAPATVPENAPQLPGAEAPVEPTPMPATSSAPAATRVPKHASPSR